MNNQEKVRAKLEQNKTDQKKLLDEQVRLQDELSELQEPKLKHLDWGLFHGALRIFIKEYGGNFVAYDINGCRVNFNVLSGPAWKDGFYKIMGNLADDLKRNSEDLEEFGRNRCVGNRFRVYIDNTTIDFCFAEDYTSLSMDEAIRFHQKLGQLIATARRK